MFTVFCKSSHHNNNSKNDAISKNRTNKSKKNTLRGVVLTSRDMNKAKAMDMIFNVFPIGLFKESADD